MHSFIHPSRRSHAPTQRIRPRERVSILHQDLRFPIAQRSHAFLHRITSRVDVERGHIHHVIHSRDDAARLVAVAVVVDAEMGERVGDEKVSSHVARARSVERARRSNARALECDVGDG